MKRVKGIIYSRFRKTTFMLISSLHLNGVNRLLGRERELDFTRLLICTSLTNTSLHDRPPRTIAYNAMSKFLISRKRFLKFAYEYFLRSFIYCTEIEFF